MARKKARHWCSSFLPFWMVRKEVCRRSKSGGKPSLEALENRDCPALVTVTLDFDSPSTAGPSHSPSRTHARQVTIPQPNKQ